MVNRDEVVASLLSAIEARDPATSEHSRAVGMWCGRLAKTIGLSAPDQAFAALAGTLHDVGKIATPTEVLLKAGPLDWEEWEAMRAHAQIGAKMLERIPSLRDVAHIVRAHHERMDGAGYPDGLSGSSIPLLARVVSVADSFHAMISKRPYRAALSVPSALDELRAGIGTQFDAAVVDAMFDIVQPRGVVRELRALRGASG
jgi:putative nucleotidyltransferase with HDIG domain